MLGADVVNTWELLSILPALFMRRQTENRAGIPGDNGLYPIQSFVEPEFWSGAQGKVKTKQACA